MSEAKQAEVFCQVEDCEEPAVFICKYGYFCNICTLDYYSSCKLDQIIPTKIIRQNMEHLDHLINNIEERYVMYDLDS